MNSKRREEMNAKRREDFEEKRREETERTREIQAHRPPSHSFEFTTVLPDPIVLLTSFT